MTDNDNTVNIKAVDRYHHGDLRQAALDLGLLKLKQSVKPELGLRALSRDLKVSATALYRHFPSKDVLLDALAEEGMLQLGSQQKSAAEGAEDVATAFLALGEAYVVWAIENPALFALTFARAQPRDEIENSLSELHPFYLLREVVEAFLPEDIKRSQKEAFELQSWALVHGVAHIVLAGQISPDRALIRSILATRLLGATPV